MESLGLRSLTKQTIATAGKSITGDGTPVDPLQLVNDEINPGNSEYYGTDASGVKGFFPIGGAGGTPSDIPALPLGVSGAPGVSTELSRYDHVHPYPTPTQIGAQTSSANLTAFAVYVPGDFAFAATSITAGTGLTGGGDLSANRTISVVNDTTIQQVQVLNAGTTVGARSMINFVPGGSLAISTSANPSGNRIDVLISAATGGSSTPLSNTPAVSLGTASAGVATEASRQDHVHPMPSAGDVGAQSANSNLSALSGVSGSSEGFAYFSSPTAMSVTPSLPFGRGFLNILNTGAARTYIGAAEAAVSIIAGTGLTGGGDLTASRTLAVVPDSTVQRVQVQKAGVTAGERPFLNFTEGGAVQVNVSANPSGNRIDINVSAPVVNTALFALAATSIVAGTGLTGGGDLSANRTIAVVNDTTIQQVQVLNAGTTVGARSMLNFIAGGTLQIATSANPSGNRIDVLISATGGAGAGTNLGVANITNTSLDITSDTGTDATVPAATSTAAGLLTGTLKSQYDNNVPQTRAITAGTGLTGGGDLTADRTLTVVDDTTIQRIQVLNAGTTVGARPMINFIAGGTLAISTSANASSNRIDVLVSATGGGGGGGITLNKVVSQRYVSF